MSIIIAAPASASSIYITSSSAVSRTMNAQIFYQRAVTLEKLGVRAPFNPDFKRLTTQAKKSYRILEIRNKKAMHKGNPLYCKKEDENLSPRQLLKQLSLIPKIKRQKINITHAFLIIAKKKYPCRK